MFNRYGGKEYAYSDLPIAGKNAVRAYYEEEIGDEIDPNDKWGYVELPVEALKAAIGGNGEFDSFEEYHAAYIAGGDIPDHPNMDYAVILDGAYEGAEVLRDGWHRFHSYVAKGAKTIPAVQA